MALEGIRTIDCPTSSGLPGPARETLSHKDSEHRHNNTGLNNKHEHIVEVMDATRSSVRVYPGQEPSDQRPHILANLLGRQKDVSIAVEVGGPAIRGVGEQAQ